MDLEFFLKQLKGSYIITLETDQVLKEFTPKIKNHIVQLLNHSINHALHALLQKNLEQANGVNNDG